jgi:hypothetical protein
MVLHKPPIEFGAALDAVRGENDVLERGVRRYYLHRWPSQRSMKRVRQRVHDLTGRNRNGVKDIRVLIRDLNPILRGWATTSAPGMPPSSSSTLTDMSGGGWFAF